MEDRARRVDRAVKELEEFGVTRDDVEELVGRRDVGGRTKKRKMWYEF